MDNAKYHSRLSGETPTINMKKRFNLFMTKHIDIPTSLSVKPVFLDKIHEANIPKKLSLMRWSTQLVTQFFVCHPIILYLTQLKWFGTSCSTYEYLHKSTSKNYRSTQECL